MSPLGSLTSIKSLCKVGFAQVLCSSSNIFMSVLWDSLFYWPGGGQDMQILPCVHLRSLGMPAPCTGVGQWPHMSLSQRRRAILHVHFFGLSLIYPRMLCAIHPDTVALIES